MKHFFSGIMKIKPLLDRQKINPYENLNQSGPIMTNP